MTTEKLAASPLSPINEASGAWADAKASYRLFSNTNATPAAILKPHTNETVKRMVNCGETVLAVQDTVYFSYATHMKTTGLGPIGKADNGSDRGLIMHNALAFTTSGLVLGILSQQIWARKKIPGETELERIRRLQCTPIDEKESAKWLHALRQTVARTPPGVRVVTVADRESDFYEFIAEAIKLKTSYLIRARVDRQLKGDDGFTNMTEAIFSPPALGTLTLNIPGNGKRKERTAMVEIRSVKVTIKPPRRSGKAKITASIEPLTVNVVAATETAPPEGCEAVSWVLLTNLPIRNFEDAVEKVEWYGKRWGIETWHKVLKSGCKVEDCLLETADRLKRFLTLFSIIGFRLMHITYFARLKPDAPSTELFSEEEIETLHIRVERTAPPQDPPLAVKEAIRMLGRLGGHLGRKCDGEPGTTVLWRGMTRLYESIEAMLAYKAFLSAKNAS